MMHAPKISALAAAGLTIFLAILMLGGCAMRGNMSGAGSESLSRAADKDPIKVADLMVQLHHAMIALHHVVTENSVLSALDLELDEAVVTIQSTHVSSEDGTLALVIAAEDDEATGASSTLKLTISPPADGNLDFSAKPAEESMARDLITHLANAAPCEFGAGAAASDMAADQRQGQRQDPLWISIVQLSLAALDGYLCATHKTGANTHNLTEFELTLAINATRKDTGGLTLTLGNISLGDTATVATGSEATLKVKLSKR